MVGNIMEELFFTGNTVKIEYRSSLLHKLALTTIVHNLTEKTLELQLTNPEPEKLAALRPGIGMAISARMQNTTQFCFYSSELIELQSGSPCLLLVKRPTLIHNVSRRNFFRCDVEFPFYILKQETKISGKVINLSASGLYGLCADTQNLKLSSLFSLELLVPKLSEPIVLDAKLLRLQKLDQTEERGMAFEFENPPEKIQNDIIKYLFQRQRELIQNGMIKVGNVK